MAGAFIPDPFPRSFQAGFLYFKAHGILLMNSMFIQNLANARQQR